MKESQQPYPYIRENATYLEMFEALVRAGISRNVILDRIEEYIQEGGDQEFPELEFSDSLSVSEAVQKVLGDLWNQHFPDKTAPQERVSECTGRQEILENLLERFSDLKDLYDISCQQLGKEEVKQRLERIQYLTPRTIGEVLRNEEYQKSAFKPPSKPNMKGWGDTSWTPEKDKEEENSSHIENHIHENWLAVEIAVEQGTYDDFAKAFVVFAKDIEAFGKKMESFGDVDLSLQSCIDFLKRQEVIDHIMYLQQHKRSSYVDNIKGGLCLLRACYEKEPNATMFLKKLDALEDHFDSFDLEEFL